MEKAGSLFRFRKRKFSTKRKIFHKIHTLTVTILKIKEVRLAVVIRLTRRGTKKKPFYRIVAADSRFPRDGRFLEILGTFDPLKEADNCNVDTEKASAWIAKGAQPSKTVASLLKKAGIGQ